MRWFFIFLIFYLGSLNLHLPEKLAPLSTKLQHKCAKAFPEEMKSRVLAQSFVCGTKLSDAQAKEIFRSTGLLHLMVVSGGHLQILAFFILAPWPQRFKNRIWVSALLWTSLISYCLLTGFQPPLVRAFVARILMSLNHRYKFFWDMGKVQLFAGLVVLALIPDWILSFSFYLSWLASLGFLLAPLWQRENSSSLLKNTINCFLIHSLLAVSFSQFSVLSVLMNAFCAPLISLSLLPLSSSVLLIPKLSLWADKAWDLLMQFLTFMAHYQFQSDPSFPDLNSVRWIGLWIFLSLSHSFFEVLRKFRYRGSRV